LKFTLGASIIDIHRFPKLDVGRSQNSENYWLEKSPKNTGRENELNLPAREAGTASKVNKRLDPISRTGNADKDMLPTPPLFLQRGEVSTKLSSLWV